jgi:hypothetical protein
MFVSNTEISPTNIYFSSRISSRVSQNTYQLELRDLVKIADRMVTVRAISEAERAKSSWKASQPGAHFFPEWSSNVLH